MSAKSEAANKRAQALGFKNAYDRRIKTALAKGKSKQQARGNHPKETKVRIKAPVPTSYHVHGFQNLGHGQRRERNIDIPLSPVQGKEVKRLLDLGKPITAKTYVLAAVYGSNSPDLYPSSGGTPKLAGVEKYQPGYDYDTNRLFGERKNSQDKTEVYGIDYSDYDYDLDDYDDYDYDDGGTDPAIH